MKRVKIATRLIFILSLVPCLFISCHQEHIYNITLNPYNFKLGGSLDELQNQLKSRSNSLSYDNSYSGNQPGLKLCSFDDGLDNLNYHVECYLIDDHLQGISVIVTSKHLNKFELSNMVSMTIVPQLESSVKGIKSIRTKIYMENGSDTEHASQVHIHVQTAVLENNMRY
jgi:hypothetical protein